MMKPMVHRVAACLLVAVLTAPVLSERVLADDPPAAERPKTMPTRDVDVTYTMTRNAKSLNERTRWSATDGRQRVDPPDHNLHLVMDHKQHLAWLIDDENRSVMNLAPPKLGPLDPASEASFTRHGVATIAGLGCTEWETKSGGPDTLICLTDDGVLLRVQAAGHTLIEATSVTYAPEAAALFEIPADYRHIDPPPRGMPRPPPPTMTPPTPPSMSPGATPAPVAPPPG